MTLLSIEYKQEDTTNSLKTLVTLLHTLECVSSVQVQQMLTDHWPVLIFHISISRNLSLASYETWKHCSCCRLAEMFVCVVAGLKQQ